MAVDGFSSLRARSLSPDLHFAGLPAVLSEAQVETVAGEILLAEAINQRRGRQTVGTWHAIYPRWLLFQLQSIGRLQTTEQVLDTGPLGGITLGAIHALHEKNERLRHQRGILPVEESTLFDFGNHVLEYRHGNREMTGGE